MKRDDPVLDVDLLPRLAEELTAVLPEPQAAARLKARILARVAVEARVPERPRYSTSSATALGLQTLRAAEANWVSLAPKVELRLLRQDRESRTFLLRLGPGAVLPPHDHPQEEEECYVLEGEVRFGDVQVLAGDYHLAPQGVPHGLVRSRHGALLLLRAANPH